FYQSIDCELYFCHLHYFQQTHKILVCAYASRLFSFTKGTVLPFGNSFTKIPFFLYTIYVLFTLASILARSPVILTHLSAQANFLFGTLLCFSDISYTPPLLILYQIIVIIYINVYIFSNLMLDNTSAIVFPFSNIAPQHASDCSRRSLIQ